MNSINKSTKSASVPTPWPAPSLGSNGAWHVRAARDSERAAVPTALPALDWNRFTQSTQTGSGAAAWPMPLGQLMMVGFTVLVSTPIGVLAGVYLAEYSGQSKTAELTRFVTEIMLSAPSLVLGLFGVRDAVATVGNFSGWAGSRPCRDCRAGRGAHNREHAAPGARSCAKRLLHWVRRAGRWSIMVTLRAARSGV